MTEFNTCTSQAHWISYPGDYGIWLGNEVQCRRLKWSNRMPPTWPMYAPYPTVSFSTTIPELDEPEDVTIEADGQYIVFCSTSKIFEPGDRLGRFTINPGKDITFGVRVYNSARPPAIRVKGKRVNSGESWVCSWNRSDSVPAELIGTSQLPPALEKFPVKHVEPVHTWRDSKGRLFADFGEETYGYLKLKDVRGEGVLKIVYAESLPEAEAEEFDDGSMKRVLDGWELVNLTACEEHRRTFPAGFRYVCIRPWSGEISVESVAMDFEWNPAELRGAFRCDDEELNRIWDVSVRTLSLTRREVMVEGIKRDHWCWSGDAVQNFLMDYYTCADYTGIRNTLWALRGKEPVVQHLNSIMDYSWYWFDAVGKYALYSGDTRFLGQVYPRMKTFIDWAIARLDSKGRPHDRPGDWIFIDWAPAPLNNTDGVTSFEQMLFIRALEATADVADKTGNNCDAASYRERAASLKSEIRSLFWNSEKRCLMHILKDDGGLDETVTRYPNIFGLLYGYFTKEEAAGIAENVILNDEVMKIQTPYMRFYELESLCALGMQKEVLGEIKSYWGGMLKLGATSFWELYNPTEKGSEHYAMYGRDFGRSLCHAWGASPVYLIGKYFLGVEPTSDGFATYSVKPNLGGLKWFSGKVPTPRGEIEVEAGNGTVRVKGIQGCTGTLYVNGEAHVINGTECVEVEA